jgi:glycosyltransferase involved in cell wall biosynthesis
MMSDSKEKTHAIILEIGDIRTDGRCKNIADSFISYGGRVTFLGPSDKDSRELDGNIVLQYLKIRRNWGSKVAYLHYWIRAFFTAIRLKPDIIIAEDLFSLPPALLAAFYTGARVLYDAKEFYFALASLKDRRVTQWFWSTLEYLTIQFTDVVITSGERDSDILRLQYKITRPVAIHNHPPKRTGEADRTVLRRKYGIPTDHVIFLYQGWLLEGRGLPLMLDIAEQYENVFCVIMGEGKMRQEIEKRIQASDVRDRVLLTGALPYDELLKNTDGADVGCALIEDRGLSYRYARPNKLFEYIRANVPVLVSNFPAMREVVESYGIGLTADPRNRLEVLDAARILIEDAGIRERFRIACIKAAEEFTWETEEKKLFKLFNSVMG